MSLKYHHMNGFKAHFQQRKQVMILYRTLIVVTMQFSFSIIHIPIKIYVKPHVIIYDQHDASHVEAVFTIIAYQQVLRLKTFEIDLQVASRDIFFY